MEDLNKILADIPQEGANPFGGVEEETPSESLPEKKEEEVQETDDSKKEETDENVPFHKHPRWIERENELKELKERDDANAREIAELKAMTESRNTGNSTIPEWFSELYGDNETAWNKYNEHEQARTEEIETRIIARQKEEEQKALQETEQWNRWVDTEITSLKDEGNDFDRNKLIKVMLDYSPTDENNNLDFKKGFAIYQALESKPDNGKSKAHKELADKTTATTKGEPVTKDYMTPSDLRNRSWGSL